MHYSYYKDMDMDRKRLEKYGIHQYIVRKDKVKGSVNPSPIGSPIFTTILLFAFQYATLNKWEIALGLMRLQPSAFHITTLFICYMLYDSPHFSQNEIKSFLRVMSKLYTTQTGE